MPLIPGWGSANQGSELQYLLNDLVSGQGSFLNQTQGSLQWIEALVIARMLNAIIEFLRGLSLQLDPAQATVFLNRYAGVYLNAPNFTPVALSDFIKILELQIGNPPTLNNVTLALQNILGVPTQNNGLFVGLEWIHLQNDLYSSYAPPGTSGALPGVQMNSMVSNIIVHCWFPRDKNDNLLLSQNYVLANLYNWIPSVQNWIPVACHMYVVTPANAGGTFGDGHPNFNDGYNNPVTLTVGSSVVNSLLLAGDSNFENDFKLVYNGIQVGQIFEIVDDTNTLQTYYVQSVQSKTQLTLTTPAINNATARTYRTYGIQVGVTQLGPGFCCGF
jgi:hypothetical protein